MTATDSALAVLSDYRMLFELPKKEWSLEKYHALIEHGILTRDDKVELIFGQIIQMNPIGIAHSATVNLISRLFFERFPKDGYTIGVQNPVTLPNASEPEPDIYVARGPLNSYLNNHPTGKDLHLVIEVADATLRKDTGLKRLSYATSGIVEYWVVDVFGRKVIQYTQPDPEGTYRQETTYRENETITSVHLGDFTSNDLMVIYE